ncbi:MAG: hypothetical protein JHC84_19885 [Solirubrobacteraceae bacterium]|nr:hypothetical protein [Solirubrobacteraceae bacterium]
MKRVCALSIATIAMAAIGAGSAHAAVSLSASVSPTKAGTPENPRPASVNVSAKITGADVGAVDGSSATQSIEAKLPYPLLFNPVAFPACDAAQVRARTCPSAGKIGTGKVVGQAAGGIVQQLKLTAFNGKGYRLLLLVEGSSPLRIDSVLQGTIRSGEGQYGMSLLNEVPDNLQQPVPGVFTTVTEFQLKVDAKRKIKGKTVSYIATAGCSGGKWPFEATVTYRGGKTESGRASARCSN